MALMTIKKVRSVVAWSGEDGGAPESKVQSPKSKVNKEWDGEIGLRDYQWPVFLDHVTGILILHWARQIGKSYVLAAWAVSRLINRPGRLVTVLSNSRENGAEFVEKCAEICRRTLTPFELEDDSPSLDFDEMRMELR